MRIFVSEQNAKRLRHKDYVLTKPLRESQCNIRGEQEEALRQEHPTLAEGRFFSIDCIENYELLRELCAFGADLLVLSPTDLRQKVFDRVAEQIRCHIEIALVFLHNERQLLRNRKFIFCHFEKYVYLCKII